jgi:hypothetical protein
MLSLQMCDYCAETAEEADSHEALDFDDEQYPRLPDSVLEFRLHRRRAIVRQFMAAVRRMYYTKHTLMLTADHHPTGFHKLNGRIPWTDIAENQSHHLSKRSRPDCDYKLEEPSHMKSSGIDAWLGHWLKLQKKKKRPLVLKDTLDKSSETLPTTTDVSTQKAKRSEAQRIESDDSSDEDNVNEAGDGGPNEDPSSSTDRGRRNVDGEAQAKVLPPSPASASLTRQSRRTFLQSLSDDKMYRKLIDLLGAAKVSNYIIYTFVN